MTAPVPEVLEVLEQGAVEVEGRMPWSSNGTYLTVVDHGGRSFNAIYKPGRGERPLWDFPGGLFRREVAAYRLSARLGWGVVPETVLRPDGPMGPGSLQRFVDADFAEHYFTLLEEPAHTEGLRTIGVFDLLINNADRKSGHCLVGEGRIWAIDNGLSFHEEPKLRTVIWDFAGQEIPARLVEDMAELAETVPPELEDLLEPEELDALRRRAQALVRRPRFPAPDPERRPYPWPLV